MIRINLLPFRAAKRKENIKRQVITSFLLLLLLFAVMAFVFIRQDAKLKSLKKEEEQTKIELAALEKVVKEIKQLEKDIADLRNKVAVIKRLEENKRGPVQLLEEISLAVPKDKLWLRAFQEKGGALTLEGTAMDNETVALFMTNLERSEHVSAVELKSTRMRYLKNYNLRVSDFTLDCRTYAFEQEQKPEQTQKTSRRKRRR
jgi:type IV pilus assembly protein PilN